MSVIAFVSWSNRNELNLYHISCGCDYVEHRAARSREAIRSSIRHAAVVNQSGWPDGPRLLLHDIDPVIVEISLLPDNYSSFYYNLSLQLTFVIDQKTIILLMTAKRIVISNSTVCRYLTFFPNLIDQFPVSRASCPSI